MSDEILINGKPIRYDLVPVDYMADGLRLYFERGILPGSFMLAILEGALYRACGHTDSTNKDHIFDWASWFYNYAPIGSYGSPEAVKNWVERHNLDEAV